MVKQKVGPCAAGLEESLSVFHYRVLSVKSADPDGYVILCIVVLDICKICNAVLGHSSLFFSAFRHSEQEFGISGHFIS